MPIWPTWAKRGDLVEVADGYARNYLIPKHLAMPSTPGDRLRPTRCGEPGTSDAAAREQAEEMATKLVTAAITITAKAGASGKLFGSVTNADVAGTIAEQTGYEVDRKVITSRTSTCARWAATRSRCSRTAMCRSRSNVEVVSA